MTSRIIYVFVLFINLMIATQANAQTDNVYQRVAVPCSPSQANEFFDSFVIEFAIPVIQTVSDLDFSRSGMSELFDTSYDIRSYYLDQMVHCLEAYPVYDATLDIVNAVILDYAETTLFYQQDWRFMELLSNVAVQAGENIGRLASITTGDRQEHLLAAIDSN